MARDQQPRKRHPSDQASFHLVAVLDNHCASGSGGFTLEMQPGLISPDFSPGGTTPFPSTPDSQRRPAFGQFNNTMRSHLNLELGLEVNFRTLLNQIRQPEDRLAGLKYQMKHTSEGVGEGCSRKPQSCPAKGKAWNLPLRKTNHRLSCSQLVPLGLGGCIHTTAMCVAHCRSVGEHPTLSSFLIHDFVPLLLVLLYELILLTFKLTYKVTGYTVTFIYACHYMLFLLSLPYTVLAPGPFFLIPFYLNNPSCFQVTQILLPPREPSNVP